MNQKAFLTECPRDAMQGLSHFIDTANKIKYLEALLAVGFDVLDFTSFVHPKAIPQLADAELVAEALSKYQGPTKLLAIVGNVRGVERLVQFSHIGLIGFPFSVSPTFLARNIHSDLEEAAQRLKAIQAMALHHQKEVVAYLSMAFGNPYGDPWSVEIVLESVGKLAESGIRRIALSDTIGEAQPEDIHTLFSSLIPAFPQVHFGAHFHTRPDNWKANLEAAWESGCRHFDGAIRGLGGCPMAKNDLTGNLPTELLLEFLKEKKAESAIQTPAFEHAYALAGQILMA